MARIALIVALLALAPAPASAAEIAVDVERGAVLVADDADAIRRPASLVKLMSAYVAFAALEIGDVTEEEIVTISARAAGQPPVKLRLRAGQKVPFGDLLAAMAIGSKNDAAVAVAEAVAKSEDAFVARMNDAAEKLGMVNTRYANASGLPASGQRTTARDVAILALALLTDHPERSLIFSERRTRAAGRGVTTTNPLFGRVPGAQGMKTGFTCAAGYNIAGLVEREGRRVLAVTLGHPGKSARLRAVKALIEKGFKALGTDEPLGPGLPDATPPPNIGGCSGAAIARADPSSDKPDALEKNDAYIPPERPGSGQKIAILPVPLPVLPKKAAPPAPAPAPVPRRPPPPLSGWASFLGAFSSERQAATHLAAVGRLATKTHRLPTKVILRPRDARHLGVIHGLSRAQAQAICALAKRAGHYCLTLSPAALLNPKARWRR